MKLPSTMSTYLKLKLITAHHFHMVNHQDSVKMAHPFTTVQHNLKLIQWLIEEIKKKHNGFVYKRKLQYFEDKKRHCYTQRVLSSPCPPTEDPLQSSRLFITDLLTELKK